MLDASAGGGDEVCFGRALLPATATATSGWEAFGRRVWLHYGRSDGSDFVGLVWVGSLLRPAKGKMLGRWRGVEACCVGLVVLVREVWSVEGRGRCGGSLIMLLPRKCLQRLCEGRAVKHSTCNCANLPSPLYVVLLEKR